MPVEKKESKGLLIRGANGELHFLRDELLEATKVTEPEMKKFLETVADQHLKTNPKAFNVQLGTIDKAIPVTGVIDKSKLDMKSMSTIMCPGVMKDKDFRVNPGDIKNRIG